MGGNPQPVPLLCSPRYPCPLPLIPVTLAPYLLPLCRTPYTAKLKTQNPKPQPQNSNAKPKIKLKTQNPKPQPQNSNAKPKITNPKFNPQNPKLKTLTQTLNPKL